MARFDFSTLRARGTLFWVLWTAGLYVVFLLVTFPHGEVARRLLQGVEANTGIRVEFGDVSLIPWAGWRFEEVSLPAADGTGFPLFEARGAVVRPPIGLFLGGDGGRVRFDLDAYRGEVQGSVAWDDAVETAVSFEGLSLAHYPRLADLAEGDWSGRLAGELRIAVGESVRTLEGEGKLRLADAGLSNGSIRGFRVPDFSIASGSADFEIRSGRLEVSELALTGPDFDATIRGQIYLREPISQSVVNLSASVEPVPGGSPDIEAVLLLAKGNQKPPTGVYEFSLYGTLSGIRVR